MSILLALSPAPAGITISGALVAGSSSLSGSLVSSSTITGALSAQASTVSGLVEVSDPLGITCSGTLLAQAATVAGSLTGSTVVTGALASQASSITGSLIGSSTVSGALSAQSAQVSGALTVSWLLFSPDVYLLEEGTDKYQLEDLSGFYRREEIALTSEASTVSGALFVVPIVTGGGGIIYYRGKRKRKKTDELFDSIEKSLREQIYGVPETEQAQAAAAPAIDASQGIEVALRELTRAARGHADLSFRLAAIRKEIAEHEERERQARAREDDDEFLMMS